MSSLSEIQFPITYLITQGNLTSANFVSESEKTISTIRSAIEAGVSCIQIREKNLSSKPLLNLLNSVIEIRKDSKTKLFVNERFDIALAAKVDGVHLSSNSIPVKKVHKNVPKSFLIGVSTHSSKAARKAKIEGADFVTFSPIFETLSKPNYGEPKGLKKLSNLCDELKPFPVVALGGVNENNFRDIYKTGAKGIAGISFFRVPQNQKMAVDYLNENV